MRIRRYSALITALSQYSGVFPTHVGVFLRVFHPYAFIFRLPHARGGVSLTPGCTVYRLSSSPRTWGCFCEVFKVGEVWQVFPTHVGVFPALRGQRKPFSGLPHARGGVSSCSTLAYIEFTSSPHTWGCFFHMDAV